VSTNLTHQISSRFPDDFEETFLKNPDITLILFTPCTLPNFSWQLLGSDANPWDQWSCLPSKHNHHKKYT